MSQLSRDEQIRGDASHCRVAAQRPHSGRVDVRIVQLLRGVDDRTIKSVRDRLQKLKVGIAASLWSNRNSIYGGTVMVTSWWWWA